MYTKSLTAASILALTLFQNVGAQDVETSDIPSQCNVVCNSLVTASDDCQRYADDSNGNDDQRYQNCVCTGSNSQEVVAMCEACVYEARRENGNSESDARDNDVHQILSVCGFRTTTYSLGSGATPTARLYANTQASDSSSSVVTLTSGDGPGMSISGGNSISQSISTDPNFSRTAASISASLTDLSSSLMTASGSEASALSSSVTALSSSLAAASSAGAADNAAAPMIRDQLVFGGAAFAGAVALVAAALL